MHWRQLYMHWYHPRLTTVIVYWWAFQWHKSEGFKIMSSTAHLISGVRKFQHITPTLKDLHWSPVDKCILFKLFCMTYKALNGQAPPYLIDLLKGYTTTRSPRSADKGLLCLPKICTQKYGVWAFAYAAPTHHKALPLSIHQSSSLDMFKGCLKTHFYGLSNWCMLLVFIC